MEANKQIPLPIEDLRKDMEEAAIGDILQAKVPSFPISVFPKQVQEIIINLKGTLLYPVDYTAVGILFASSVAIGNTHRVEVKKGWEACAVLYLCIVGRPGATKTHPLAFATNPLLKADKRTVAEYRQNLEAYEIYAQFDRKEKDGVPAPPKPVLKKMLFNDYTFEALIERHGNNQRGLGVYTDELTGWFKNFNRYNKGSEEEFWLSAFNGDLFSADRKGGMPIMIDQTFISVIGGTQPKLLQEFAKGSRVDNGFMDRILFSAPDGLSKEYWVTEDLPDWVQTQYADIISKLLSLTMNLQEESAPYLLHYTNEAKKALFEWQRQNTDTIRKEQNDQLVSCYGKLETYINRFALILELLYWACGESEKEQVGIRAVEGAIQLTEYFRRHAQKIHAFLFERLPTDELPQDKRIFYKMLPEEFSTDEGLKIAKNHKITERTFKRMLNEKTLFVKEKHGRYSKKY